MTWRWNTDG